ncbi:hypothetical protein BDQ17DRAFT_1440271 [Cyathus striatus]|nr:hypothetical protein BDQ17DRAFT_1440271 [Cyathus striatus]
MDYRAVELYPSGAFTAMSNAIRSSGGYHIFRLWSMIVYANRWGSARPRDMLWATSISLLTLPTFTTASLQSSYTVSPLLSSPLYFHYAQIAAPLGRRELIRRWALYGFRRHQEAGDGQLLIGCSGEVGGMREEQGR